MLPLLSPRTLITIIVSFHTFSSTEVKKHHEGSSSGYDVYDESGSATKLYYADEVSGSGSGDVKDEDEDDEDDGKDTLFKESVKVEDLSPFTANNTSQQPCFNKP